MAKPSLKDASASIALESKTPSFAGHYVYVAAPAPVGAGAPPPSPLVPMPPLSRALHGSPASDSSDTDEEDKLPIVGLTMLGGIRTGRGSKTVRVGKSLPPPLSVTPIYNRVVRFRLSSAASGVGAGLGGVLGALGGICTVVNSKLTTYASTAKIRSVKVWLPAVAGLDNVFVDWGPSSFGGFVPDSAAISTLPDGITATQGLIFTPPAKSLAGAWLSPNVISLSTALLAFTLPAGSVVDLDVDFTLSNTVLGSQITVSTATLASTYFLALDGPASNKFVPLGVPTTS